MMKRHGWAVLSMGIIMAAMFTEQASANYSIYWEIRESGHIKMWWTKDGIRITEYPFIDNDMTAPMTYSSIAPTKDINDHHEQWIRSNNKKTSMSAVAGLGYPFPTFEDYFTAQSVESVAWYALADETGDFDVDIEVDLVAWGNFLKANPIPDPASLFMFTGGQCAILPGYSAMNAETDTPFNGVMEVVGINTLAVPEPATLAILALGGLGVVGGAVQRRTKRRG